jgi:hypothetical protein
LSGWAEKANYRQKGLPTSLNMIAGSSGNDIAPNIEFPNDISFMETVGILDTSKAIYSMDMRILLRRKLINYESDY